jgi:hypothetical protein
MMAGSVVQDNKLEVHIGVLGLFDIQKFLA